MKADQIPQKSSLVVNIDSGARFVLMESKRCSTLLFCRMIFKKIRSQFFASYSNASVDRFIALASSFTGDATVSKRIAIQPPNREGILTAKGKLSKHYSTK